MLDIFEIGCRKIHMMAEVTPCYCTGDIMWPILASRIPILAKISMKQNMTQFSGYNSTFIESHYETIEFNLIMLKTLWETCFISLIAENSGRFNYRWSKNPTTVVGACRHLSETRENSSCNNRPIILFLFYHRLLGRKTIKSQWRHP
jgi:hypothetical protein